MHQSFRNGFEKVSFLFVDPAGYKAGLQRMGKNLTESGISKKEMTRNVVKNVSKMKNEIGNLHGTMSGDTKRLEQETRKLFPKGTQAPGTKVPSSDKHETYLRMDRALQKKKPTLFNLNEG